LVYSDIISNDNLLTIFSSFSILSAVVRKFEDLNGSIIPDVSKYVVVYYETMRIKTCGLLEETLKGFMGKVSMYSCLPYGLVLAIIIEVFC
jgi:hypothetical protein